jgi:tRNA 2-thiouridine synthesizing protein B
MNDIEQEQYDVFLLTKPPHNSRADLCLKLAGRSGNLRLYLAGDGVYHLLAGIEEMPGFKVYACQQDLEARAIKAGEKVIVPDDFYAVFVEDVMEHCRRAYTF